MNIKRLLAAFLLLFTLTLVSCGTRYTCVWTTGEVEKLDPPAEPLTEITIGENTYTVEWQFAGKNEFTGKIVDSYRVKPNAFDFTIDTESGHMARIYPTFKIERESGNITSFHHFTDFPLTEEITFESLQKVIEAHFPYIDFGDFDVKTAREDNFSSTSDMKNGTYYLWEKENENVDLTVYVDGNGNLRDLSYDYAPPEEKRLSISDEERDALIEKTLKKTPLWEKGMTFTTELAYYTQYKEKNAILYVVHLEDESGFSHGVTPIIIHE